MEILLRVHFQHGDPVRRLASNPYTVDSALAHFPAHTAVIGEQR